MRKNAFKFITIFICLFFVMINNSFASFWDYWADEDEEANINKSSSKFISTDTTTKDIKDKLNNAKEIENSLYQSRNANYSKSNNNAFFDIDELNKQKLLMQKDIDFLVQENNGIKEDIKEIKGTLQQIAVSIAEIAVHYKNYKENCKKR